jgi:hypothetical protein
MRQNTYERLRGEQIEIQRSLSQGTATIRSANFGKAWRAIYPIKAAEQLASASGCSVRTAASQLSGEFDVSARSLAALIQVCLH